MVASVAQHHQQVLGVDLAARLHVDGLDRRRRGRRAGRFPSSSPRWSAAGRPPAPSGPAVTATEATTPGIGAPTWAGLPVLRLGLGGRLGLDRAVRHPDHARLAVQLEEHLDLAVLGRLAHRLQADFQRLAGVDLDRDLLARLHAVEEGRRRQRAHRAVDRGGGSGSR